MPPVNRTLQNIYIVYKGKDHTQTAGSKLTVSCVITEYLVEALRGTAQFWSEDHSLLMGQVRDEIRRRHTEDMETALGGGPGLRVHIRRPPGETDHADRGMAVSAAIYSQWVGVRGTGMEGFPFLAIWHLDP